MILKSVALLTLISIAIAMEPEPAPHEDRPESYNVYKSSVEQLNVKEYYGKHNNKKDHYEKKNKYYDDEKPYKKQKYYKDENTKPYPKKEKNYNKHWEEREYSKYNEKEYRHDPDYLNLNEIDSNDFQKNKHAKYDKHSKHPNHFDDTRKNAEVAPHEKHERNEEKYFEREKKHKDKSYPPHKEHPKQKFDLQDDTKVNYLFDRPVNPDSEFIDDRKAVKHDRNSEFIDDRKAVKHDRNSEHDRNKENYEANYQNNDETFVKRVKKDFYKEMKVINLSNPPPTNETVLMARYIIHNVDWAALATVSARNPTRGTPFANIKSVSDGPVNKGSGVPFFYLTPRDLSSQDLNKDNRCTVTVTLAETSYCRNENYDPEDPRCARLILSGKIKRIKAGTTEEDFAKEALFSRHPAMSTWPADHDWFFAKLKIGQIVLLDMFGGPKYIDVQEYLNVEPPTRT